MSKSLLFSSLILGFLAGAAGICGGLTPALAYPDADTMQYYQGFEPTDPKDWDSGATVQLVQSTGGSSTLMAHPSKRGESKWFALIGDPAAGEWSAINHWQTVRAGDSCVFAVWVKTSGELPNGYVSVRRQDPGTGGPGPVVAEHNLSGLRPAGDAKDNGYQLVQVDFPTGDSTKLLFYVGLWGDDKNSWIEIDDVTILCDPLGPAEAGNNGRGDPKKGERERIENF
jgi:hypothetical protein